MSDGEEGNEEASDAWDDAVETMKTLNVVVTDEQLRAWKADAADFARNTLFDMKQFVNDYELRLGGPIQKRVCAHLNILKDERKSKIFWEDNHGQEVVRKAFGRKRQTTLTAVKAGFRGKNSGEGCTDMGSLRGIYSYNYFGCCLSEKNRMGE
jgi:hypothetical protein